MTCPIFFKRNSFFIVLTVKYSESSAYYLEMTFISQEFSKQRLTPSNSALFHNVSNNTITS